MRVPFPYFDDVKKGESYLWRDFLLYFLLFFFMYLTLSFVAGHVFGLDMYFVLWTTFGYVYLFVVVFSFINMCFNLLLCHENVLTWIVIFCKTFIYA